MHVPEMRGPTNQMVHVSVLREQQELQNWCPHEARASGDGRGHLFLVDAVRMLLKPQQMGYNAVLYYCHELQII